jgi:hypothetical protein
LAKHFPADGIVTSRLCFQSGFRVPQFSRGLCARTGLSRRIRSTTPPSAPTQPQHVPVRILDLHLDGPRVVRRRHADGHAAGLQFRIDDCNVLNAEPDPCPTASLAAATQVDARAVAIHRREVVIAPRRIGESQNADLKAPAGLHVLYAQDGLAAFVMDARGPWIGHNNSSF